ncbi:MAG: aminopeptidase [Lysobacterales bacterium CG_4_10_14_3_um_filter_64_11]|nr:MAG: aminopeptidase [Xanthomonadales bacterium CG_4_10_14_3_um_filter_64_11]
MATRVLALAALLIASQPAFASEAAFTPDDLHTAAYLRDLANGGSAAYDIVESLTTEVGPRMAGSDADPRAVAWAQAKFRELGFDRVWTEPVSFPLWRRGAEQAQVLSPYPQPLHITTLGLSVGSNGPLEGEVVAFADLAALSAAPAGSLDGKIAFIANRMTRSRDGKGYGPAVAARSRGASEASGKGALALLIRSIGTDHARMPHTGALQYAEGNDAPPRIPAAALSNPDADLLANMVRRGQPVRLRLNIDAGVVGEATSYNVIGEITGSEQPEQVVLIGGHLDSWDLGTGAIDDASGVAITMAAGAMIGDLKTPPKRSIRVIAFANEEQGLFGGKAYAEQHKTQISQHILGAESDFGAGRIYALRAGTSDATRPTIAAIGEVLEPLGITYESEGGGPGPDIIAVAGRGMAWAQLAQDGGDYFDHHHTANDTLDKIDPRALDQQVAAYAVLAYLAAQTDGGFGSAAKPEAP